MPQPTQARTKNKAEQEAQQKALRRAEQANILAGVRPILEEEEQLLAFARTRIAGGWRGKLNVGPEAFFAPFANVALTERRFIVQHVHHSSGRPSEMLPHSYALGAITRATFTDIETFGGEPACRLILHLQNGLYVRLRLRGQLNFAAAQNMVELFDSLTLAQRAVPVSPLQTTCANCHQILDQDYKFCPYCGAAQASAAGITLATDEGNRLPQPENAEDQAPTYVLQETDFAYERTDRPAEFGTALPFPDIEQPEVGSEPIPQDEVTPLETGITTAVTTEEQDATPDASEEMLDSVAPENFADAGLFTPLSDSAPLPGEPQQATETTDTTAEETNGKRQTLEPDDLTTLDYPLSADFETAGTVPTTATEAESAAGADFGQYESQDFAELPDTEQESENTTENEAANETESGADSGSDEPTKSTANVEGSAFDVVHDDISEAFLPPSNSPDAEQPEAAPSDKPSAENASATDPAPHQASGENQS